MTQVVRFLNLIIMVAILSMLHTSCKKEKTLTSGGQLLFSVDTLTFDTVFTSLGSFTAEVKIFNPQDQKINVSSIRLENTDGPFFHINVNGVSANDVNNIEVAAHDSIYVFATVKIDPKNQDNPFVINGKVIATLNGKDYVLPLMAYGQDAHYIVDSVMNTQTWLTDRPYVIIHNALVDKGQTLVIPAGCRIYVHADSRLYIDGTLKAIGTKKDSIIFQGDRLDRKYFGNEGYPGEWGGLYFTSHSSGNELDYVILKNCGNSTRIGAGATQPAAIQVNIDSTGSGDFALKMRHTIVENSIGYGLLCFTGTVQASNCLFNTCGAQTLAIFQGGTYEFNNCDFVTYGTNKVNHTDNPVAAILNYFTVDDVNYTLGDLQATLRNCIIYGSLDTEFIALSKPNAAFNVRLENCLIKGYIPGGISNDNCILNKDPQFKDYSTWDYHPQSGSPVIDKGATVPGITDDLDGNARTGNPDIGCYEFK